jgi:hypothetical protein
MICCGSWRDPRQSPKWGRPSAFHDDLTEASVVSWRVLREAPELLDLSDHAPIEVVIA